MNQYHYQSLSLTLGLGNIKYYATLYTAIWMGCSKPHLPPAHAVASQR